MYKRQKQAVEEHQLNDSAAYALFRKALTGKALDNSIISEDNGTDFRNYFLQIQLLNTHQDDKTELRTELDKIRASKPKHMPTTMMRIHEIHNKLNREADSEKARMDLVIQLTRTDIFDIIRSHYPFLYSQIVEKENAIRCLLYTSPSPRD